VLALAMVKHHQATYAPNQRRYDPARRPAAKQFGSAWHADEEPDAAGWLAAHLSRRSTDERLLHDAR